MLTVHSFFYPFTFHPSPPVPSGGKMVCFCFGRIRMFFENRSHMHEYCICIYVFRNCNRTIMFDRGHCWKKRDDNRDEIRADDLIPQSSYIKSNILKWYAFTYSFFSRSIYIIINHIIPEFCNAYFNTCNYNGINNGQL